MFSVLFIVGQRKKEAPAPGRSEDHQHWLAEDGLLGSGRIRRAEGIRSEAVAAENRALPRNARTCILWCAIALGALVRGCPSADVGVLH